MLCTLVQAAVGLAPLAVFLWLVARVALDPYQRWINYNVAGSRAILAFAYLNGIGSGMIIGGTILSFAAGLSAFSKRNIRVLIVTTIGLAVIVLFSVSPWATARISKSRAWPNRCDGEWLEAVLYGPSYESQTLVGHFDVNLVSTGQKQFTYTHTLGANFSTVELTEVSPLATITTALHKINYDWRFESVEGSCSADSMDSCVSGMIRSSGNVVFDLNINGTRARSRGYDRVWSFDNAPLLDLRDFDDDNKIVMQTSMHRCPRMKVCVPYTDVGANVLQSEVVVPMGWVMDKAAMWSRKCTKLVAPGPYVTM